MLSCLFVRGGVGGGEGHCWTNLSYTVDVLFPSILPLLLPSLLSFLHFLLVCLPASLLWITVLSPEPYFRICSNLKSCESFPYRFSRGSLYSSFVCRLDPWHTSIQDFHLFKRVPKHHLFNSLSSRETYSYCRGRLSQGSNFKMVIVKLTLSFLLMGGLDWWMEEEGRCYCGFIACWSPNSGVQGYVIFVLCKERSVFPFIQDLPKLSDVYRAIGKNKITSFLPFLVWQTKSCFW